MSILMILSFLFSVGGTMQTDAKSNHTMDTLKLQYKLTGDGVPLVLLPGGLTGSSSWDSFLPDFSANNQVVQLQLISVQCGLENRELPQNYSVRLESDAIAESLKDIGISNPTGFYRLVIWLICPVGFCPESSSTCAIADTD